MATARDPFAVHVAGHHLAPEGDRRQDGRLGRACESFDVGRRVPLGVAQCLRFGQGFVNDAPDSVMRVSTKLVVP